MTVKPKAAVASQDDPALIDKIAEMLATVDPARWRKNDRELDDQERFAQMRQSWERIYALVLENATLVLRCSQGVRSDYVTGGYTLTPVGLPRYLVELRAQGWDALELCDPRQSGSGSKKQYETLVQGDAAKLLFACVARTVNDCERNRRKDFTSAAEAIFSEIDTLIAESETGAWQRIHEGDQLTSYKAALNELIITVSQEELKDNRRFSLRVEKEDLSLACRDREIAQRAFEKISKREEQAGLLALSRALQSLE